MKPHSLNLNCGAGLRVCVGIALSVVSSVCPAGTYSGGDGSAANPYRIADADDLLELAGSAADYRRCFVLTGDVDLSGYSFTRAVIAPDTDDSDFNFQGTMFTGVFDGQDPDTGVVHSISNMDIANSSGRWYIGLFGCTWGAVIKNVRLTNFKIAVSGVENCYVGALIGSCWGTVTNCSAVGSITGGNHARLFGGLVGKLQLGSSISACSTAGSITVGEHSRSIGGLVGYSQGSVSKCSAAASITAGPESTQVGGLLGEASSNPIINCRATGDVKAFESYSGYDNECFGGLVGVTYAPIYGCYATGNVSAEYEVGGLVGVTTEPITNCYATGGVTGLYFFGGLVGNHFSDRIANCYAVGRVTRVASYADKYGGLIGAQDERFDPVTESCFWDTESSGMTVGIGYGSTTGITGLTTAQMKTLSTFTAAGWDFTTVWFMDPDSYPRFRWDGKYLGNGTETNPYVIDSIETLYHMMQLPQDWDKYFILTADLDLWGEVFTQALVAPDTDSAAAGFQGTAFRGVFDGNGYVIRRIMINMPAGDFAGLFGYVYSGGRIHNLTVENVTVTGRHYAGGLAGASSGIITGCRAAGTITGAGDFTGALAGWNGGEISHCHAEGSVVGTTYVGGLTGYNKAGTGTISSSYATATTDGSEAVGGLVGENLGSLSSSYATGNVAGTSGVGGLAGKNSGTVYRCYAQGTAKGKVFWLPPSHYFNSNYVGGLIGYNSGAIISSYATGAVSRQGTGGSLSNAGGLVGRNEAGAITSCYATGAVGGSSAVGGLVGWNSAGAVIGCYSCGVPTGSSNVGGLCGSATTGGMYQDTANFWDTEASQRITSAMGAGRTTAQMKTASTFTSAGWDFAGLWWMPYDAYPRLRWQRRHVHAGSEADPYRINGLADFYMMMQFPEDWDKYYILTADLNLSGTVFAGALIAPDTDSLARGFQGTVFAGQFDGAGHVIRNLTIYSKFARDYVGLFGCVGETSPRGRSGVIKNLGLEKVDVRGRSYVGGLVGKNHRGTISGCYTTGTVDGSGSCAGGLVGYHGPGTAEMWACIITDSYARCAVGNGTAVGGLIGTTYRSEVIHCYSTGMPKGTSSVGGLCGGVDTEKGYEDIGNFWDVITSQCETSAMGMGLETKAMKAYSTFAEAEWDFKTTWAICEETNYPRLQWRIAAADWVCPDGVAAEDLEHFAARWLMRNCAGSGYCDGADMNLSGQVDAADFALLAAFWLQGK